MTWNELKAHIEVMDEKQANTDVTFFDNRNGDNRNNFFGVKGIAFTDPNLPYGFLDPNHPYLVTL